MTAGSILVDVVCALPDEQVVVSLCLPCGSTATDAIRDSELPERFKAYLTEPLRVGIYGVLLDAPATYVLQSGDRLELYRPLQLDPKEARRLRADKARRQKRHT